MSDVDLEKIIEYSQKMNLLYVEDNADAREMTSMILGDFFGEISVAVDGLDGIDKFRNNDYDLIITDINMPNMNGLEMIEKIREINQDIPIVILSAHNEDDFFINSIKLGVDGYLLKPIDLEQMITVLNRVIQKNIYKIEAKTNLKLLEEYKEATNQSSIVSKTDIRGIITYVNDKFCEISGYTKEELIGKNHNIIRHPDNPKSIFKEMWDTIKKDKKIWKGIVRNRAKNGKSYYTDSIVMPILDLDGNILEFISLRHDVTNIMNPSKQLTEALKNHKNPVLIYMKLDRFDTMVEFYDNEYVEKIQDKTAEYLQNRFSEIYEFDKVYQLENGEYAFIIEKDKFLSQSEVAFIKTSREYQSAINDDKIVIDDIEHDIDILISVVYEKDKILESAKLGIKKLLRDNKIFIVANNLAQIEQENAKKNMKTISMIKDAIKSSRIVSYFQPIIDNSTKEIVKYESLVRLIDGDGKVLTPYFFLDTAKKSNYYTDITNIVLEHSFAILNACNFDISINLSAIDIEQKNTRQKVIELLEKNRDNAKRVVFELLEDEGVKDFELIKRFVLDVKAYGAKIAIDDFGAGYSNFERLLDFQPDILKIDGSLIKDIETNSYSVSVVKTIVTFAKEQHIQTIAEFIENESIFEIVKELGVDYSQGYYFGKPEPKIET